MYPALKKLDPNHQERWFHVENFTPFPSRFDPTVWVEIWIRVEINAKKFWIIQAIIIRMIYLTKIPLHQVQWCELPENLHEPPPEPRHETRLVIHSRTRQETQDTHLNYHEILPGKCSNRIILIHFRSILIYYRSIFDPFLANVDSFLYVFISFRPIFINFRSILIQFELNFGPFWNIFDAFSNCFRNFLFSFWSIFDEKMPYLH